MYLRANELDRAAADLAKAHELAPESGEVEALLGWLARNRASSPTPSPISARRLKAVPAICATFTPSPRPSSRPAAPTPTPNSRGSSNRGSKVEPNNLFLMRERLGVAVRRGDRAAVDELLARFKELSPEWTPEGRRVRQVCAARPRRGRCRATRWTLPFPSATSSPLNADIKRPERGVPGRRPGGRTCRPIPRLAPMRTVVAAPDLGVTFTAEPPNAAAPAEPTRPGRSG